MKNSHATRGHVDNPSAPFTSFSAQSPVVIKSSAQNERANDTPYNDNVLIIMKEMKLINVNVQSQASLG